MAGAPFAVARLARAMAEGEDINDRLSQGYEKFMKKRLNSFCVLGVSS
jgi:hypothetical protein